MTVQELFDRCIEKGLNPEHTNLYVYYNSALGYMPANVITEECYGICLDYEK